MTISKCRHDLPLLSHTIWWVTPVAATNVPASSMSSCVPSPTMFKSVWCCRANCSTSGASRRHVVQCGAHAQNSVGLSPATNDAKLTVCPDVTSVTSIAGSTAAALVALGTGAGTSDVPGTELDGLRTAATVDDGLTPVVGAGATTETTPLKAVVTALVVTVLAGLEAATIAPLPVSLSMEALDPLHAVAATATTPMTAARRKDLTRQAYGPAGG